MKLYYSPGACSLASHIALQETGLPFEIDRFIASTGKTASGEDFLQINPKGYVPTIRLDDGAVLTEGGAVLQYIADRNPAAGLAPEAGTMERYRLQEWLTFIGTEIHKTYSPLFSKTVSADVRDRGFDLLTRRIGFVETRLDKSPYLLGDHFTVADAYLFVVLRWSVPVGFDLTPFPKVREYMDRIAVRPGVQSAMKAEGLIQ